MENPTQSKQLTNKEKEKLLVEGLQNKKSKLYFYTPDTKGHPSGAIGHVYDLVSILKEKGYEAYIFTEAEYNMPKWLGSNYTNLPHISTAKVGTISPIDFIILPEVYVQPFFNDLNQNNLKMPCEFIVLSQMYKLIFRTLNMGNHWAKYGIKNVITTTESQKEFINKNLQDLNVHVVNPYIQPIFEKSDKPAKPFIMVFSRDNATATDIMQMFYRQYPQYAWIQNKIVTNVERKDFASSMKDCCLSIWVDDISSFGTFPLESMKCGVPVLGKIPNIMPEWMGTATQGQYKTKNNGIWVLSDNDMPSYIKGYLDLWLSDSLDPVIYSAMEETVAKYIRENTSTQLLEAIESIIANRIEKIKEIFAKQTLQPTVETAQVNPNAIAQNKPTTKLQKVK